MTRNRQLALVLLATMLSACEVDPLANRSLPKVGMIFTPNTVIEQDLYGQEEEDGSSSEPALSIEAVSPDSGSPAGGESVEVLGRGFVKGMRVYFGQVKSADVFFVNSKKLLVQTPPGGLGPVDVAVRWPDDEVRLLPSGFLYMTVLKLGAVEPAVGPVEGGTPITVTGTGFLPGTRLVIGDRLAINTEVVDQQTLYAITPPSSTGGPVDVHLSNAAGLVSGKGLFTYSVAPRLDSAAPAAGPTSGGGTVRLRGKWLSSVSKVYFGEQEAEVVEAGASELLVTAPPGSPGVVEVLAQGSWGWAVLADGYRYVDLPTLAPGELIVAPDRGPEAGGNPVTLLSCALASSMASEILFGGVQAPVEAVDAAQCLVLTTAPPGTGEVDIVALGTPLTWQQAYSYLPAMSLTEVSPKVGPAAGGSRITIRGHHFTPEVQVLVGPLAAGEVTYISAEELQATTPPGSPGLSNLTVVGLDGIALLPNAFLYTVAQPELWVITPNYGSQAGGTFVELIGAGFTQEAMLFFGDELTPMTQVKSYGRLLAYSPPHPTATVGVTVSLSIGTATLPSAYSYFDPTSWYGGTWGPPIDGAVNVTVIDASTWKGLAGAAAILGPDLATPYKGFTDLNGQVTLSGPGLKGPVDLHVSKKEHDAASIVHFDAENATVYLIPMYPPSTGPVDPVEPLPPGAVGGRVVGLGKYVVIPPGDCRNKSVGEDGLCAPCIEDVDCLDGLSCRALAKTGKFCVSPCSGGGEPACPEGYICSPAGGGEPACTPALGRRSARCTLTRNSIYTSLYSSDEYIETAKELCPAPDGKDDQCFAFDKTRLGEVAIVCLGGWEDLDTGEFHPLMMGVRRHVNIAPGASVEDQNVWLNIPLSRTLRLRLDDPPEFPAFGGLYRVTVFLDLGSDGIFQMPGSFEGLTPDDVKLEAMPEELTGDLYDASYIVYAGAYSNVSDQTPYSVVVLREITDLDATAVAFTDGLELAALEIAPKQFALRAAWASPGQLWMAGEGGRIFRYAGQSLQQYPTPVGSGLNDLHGLSDGSVVAVGEGGSVARFDGSQWKLVGTATDAVLRGVWASDPDDIYAVGKYRIVNGSPTGFDELKVPFDLFAVAGSDPDHVYAVGSKGVVLVSDGLGWEVMAGPTDQDLFAVHARPGFVIVAGRNVAAEWDGQAWHSLGLPTELTYTAIVPGTDGDFWFAAGADGAVRFNPSSGYSLVPAPDGLLVHDLALLPDGRMAAVGTPALLLTPFVPFPQFQSPLDQGPLTKLLLAWGYAPESEAISLHTIDITLASGRTLWRFTAEGSVRVIELPDFLALIGFNALPGGEKRLRIYSAHSPDFSINAFNLSSLSTNNWKSWAYDMIAFDPKPVISP